MPGRGQPPARGAVAPTVVVADGVTSIAGQEANDAALHRIKKHFGPSAVVPSSAFFPKD